MSNALASVYNDSSIDNKNVKSFFDISNSVNL